LGFDPRSAGGRASGGRRDRVPAARAASAASSARPRGGKGLRGAAGLLGVVAAVALVGALAAARWASPEREGELAMRPQPQGGFANIEPAVAPLAAAPRGRIALSAGDALASRIGDDLTRALARAGGPGVAVQDSRGWFEDLSSLRDGSRLAIARYDALQAARGDGGAGPLRIVMPLFTEELAFVVRADSPLRWIHQVEGKRINIGPPAGARALTVRTAYARLFNKPLASERSSLAGEAAALDELLGRSVDVVVLVGNAPAPWASAYPEMAGGLRLLALDRNHASTQRAMRSMLTAQLDAGADAGPDAPTTPTLAVMSFLVAGGGRAEAGAAGAAPSVDVGRVAAALCRQLPTLQRDGHPKWREVRPDLQLDAGWPYAAEAQGALRNCASQAAGPAAAPPPAASPAPRRPQQTAAGAAQAPEAS
ncbi:MAG TPA: TAXI family TRAP transporter solute-binding subunit, partial [Methylibium sp.]|uniref:TAXI family TRAP transporter solute-binding subunit n=1 Tax=Methylibium sp. TaxID=2067992 RepID=UPI002DB6D69B